MSKKAVATPQYVVNKIPGSDSNELYLYEKIEGGNSNQYKLITKVPEDKLSGGLSFAGEKFTDDPDAGVRKTTKKPKAKKTTKKQT